MVDGSPIDWAAAEGWLQSVASKDRSARMKNGRAVRFKYHCLYDQGLIAWYAIELRGYIIHSHEEI